jgi:hypothetical protein
MTTPSLPTRLVDALNAFLPWAHGHQRTAITTFVAAIIDQQTGCHAARARTQGTQEAAGKRVSRLWHNARRKPQACAEWRCRRALRHVPRTGRGRFPMDWTSEAHQPLRVVSVVVGRRAMPLCWRADAHTGLTGRRKRDALAVITRALKLMFH